MGATAGDRARSLIWREWQSSYGIKDVASTVLRDRFGCWGFVDLWRRDGSFDDAERATLAGAMEPSHRPSAGRCWRRSRSRPPRRRPVRQ